MIQKIHPALLIMTRELRDQFRDWRIVLPIFALSGIFPFVLSLAARQMLAFILQGGATIAPERIAPFLLLMVGVFPIIVSLTIALESFVGEKERGSLEALFHAPLTDGQLYLGKLLAAVVPALLSSFLGITVYLISLSRNHVELPTLDIFIQIMALTVVQAVVMISAAVVVSIQATSVRAANLMATSIIIPIGLLIQAESVVIFLGNMAALRWITLGLIALAVLLTRVGLVHFRREELMRLEMDKIDIRGSWRRFHHALIGTAKSPFDWYLHSVSHAVRRLGMPVLITALAVIVGGWLGLRQVETLSFPIPVTGQRGFHDQLSALVDAWPMFAIQPVLEVWWQNIRVLLYSFFLGLFSFGVLGVIPTLVSVGIAGYLMGMTSNLGVSPWMYLGGFLLPHGVLEVTAAIIGSAGILKLGAVLATPFPGKATGEAWVAALADWVKVMVGLVIPLLFIAAAIEVWITPRLALWLFR